MRFREFWPIYLHAHSRSGTRAMHYVATGLGSSMAGAAIIVEEGWLFPVGIGLSYIIAVLSHWGIERNQPLITVNALWGAVADLKMCWLALTGRLEQELANHGVRADSASAVSPAPKAVRGLLRG